MINDNLTLTAVLAPMAGYTDVAFRRICGELGASSATSEMISAVALCMGDEKTAALCEIGEREPPCFLQLFGHDPATMARAAKLLLSGDYPGCRYAAPPAGIDINMGCPVRKITANGDGCALMRTPALAADVASAVGEVCDRFGVPFSVKFRAGWDTVTAPAFAYALAQAGVVRMTCHCRTREQLYGPGANPAIIREVKEAVSPFGCTVVGNGDIASLADALRMREVTGCDEVAVGRAALGNPWLFASLRTGFEQIPPLDERIALACRLVEETVARRGEFAGIRESRSKAAHFIRGLPGSARVRDRLNHAETLAAFEGALREIG